MQINECEIYCKFSKLGKKQREWLSILLQSITILTYLWEKHFKIPRECLEQLNMGQ